ncbi:HupE/UreJ family protein [Streptomyces sp. ADMS]|uniref:HupE/UreJ family protein n=1 Tax=Streptomyces sp. ADMS TaxID=3071415 RepID=UPI00296F9837|nr:HupE/UreJ family protein [Streptomyces sp. ADMS]MDW4910208.1 HupE/UreJ family protein [Streptomyces sp. ADMS]
MTKATYRLLPALLLAAFFLTGLLASPAGAHPVSTSAVLLDIGEDRGDGEVQLPLDRLSIAVGRDLTGARVLGADRAFMKSYTAQHISAVGKDGEPWTVSLGTGTVRSVDSTPHLVYPLEIRPPDGEVTAFDLRYDVIVEELLTHKVIVTVRYDFDRGILKTDDAETLGIFDHAAKTLTVPADEGSWLRGFATTAGLGIEHIGEGADHLLFLLMLLIPAPLVATGGSWRAAASRRRAIMRVVHVVSAFAVGHSLTLALAATGVIDLPARPVETLIALSIAVSAIHAIRPLVAHGEVVIATGFGLIHGLAFASLITDLGLDRGSLLTTLLGFNLGIELTQLLVVALLMPSLLVLARTRFYPALRITVAVVGLLFSSSWMLERAALTSIDPFEGVQAWLVGHPLWVAVTVAGLAAAAHGSTTRTPRTAPER